MGHETGFLFVYGTLKRQFHGKIADIESILQFLKFHSEAWCYGVLYDLGSYPGMKPDPRQKNRVYGEIYTFSADQVDLLFNQLDWYEDCDMKNPQDSLYIRESIDLYSGPDQTPVKAVTYIYNRDVSPGQMISDGKYL